MAIYGSETAEKEMRFQFGKNWQGFLRLLDQSRISAAEKSLQQMLEITDLKGSSFLDAGSGSGLFSLAARNLGAKVNSFDYDQNSVACTQELKQRYYPEDNAWKVQQGDVLDQEFIGSLGMYDVVYSWGVLHHTGDMWQAFDNVRKLVQSDGLLFIAIYNDQGAISRYWTKVKRIYNSGLIGQSLMIMLHAPYLYFLRRIVRMVFYKGTSPRGMDLWRDTLDWLGGYPFEVAKPEDVIRTFRDYGFSLSQLSTCGGRQGCNQFVFRKGSIRADS